MAGKWYGVLEEIYENDEMWEMESSEISSLADRVGLEEDELEEVLQNLEHQELIKRDPDSIFLTKRGFDLISQKETHEEQLLTERLLLVFVTALALGTLVQTSVTLKQSGGLFLRIAYNAVFAITFIVLGMIAKQNLKF